CAAVVTSVTPTSRAAECACCAAWPDQRLITGRPNDRRRRRPPHADRLPQPEPRCRAPAAGARCCPARPCPKDLRPVITLHHITKIFPATRKHPPVTALDDVSVTVERGQVMGVVGPSGSGKSTLARIVNLLERPTTGTVTVDGLDLTALTSARELNSARRGIGMIFQQFNLLDSRTALANVELPLELAGAGRGERRARATALLEGVGLGDKLGSSPGQLSGGQRQRVAIARALAPRPKVLLCDEATSALDPVSTASVLALLRDLTDEL